MMKINENNVITTLIFIAIFVFVGGGGWYMIHKPPSQPVVKTETPAQKFEKKQNAAIYYSWQYIKSQLSDPDSVKFSKDIAAFNTYEGIEYAHVLGYYQAKNVYNARINASYEVIMTETDHKLIYGAINSTPFYNTDAGQMIHQKMISKTK